MLETNLLQAQKKAQEVNHKPLILLVIINGFEPPTPGLHISQFNNSAKPIQLSKLEVCAVRFSMKAPTA